MSFTPIKSLKEFYADSKHILSVSYKPDRDTFMRTTKIVVFGIIILGVMGFVIYEIITLIAH
ncbi:MAG: protein translocase SEC61 complex subunit gamma [Candidatus Micrarchaeaceae archaeon]